MMESTTYRGILEEGAIKELRKTLLRQGRIKFGAPDEATKAAIQSLTNLRRLERLSEQMLSASSWAELLATR